MKNRRHYIDPCLKTITNIKWWVWAVLVMAIAALMFLSGCTATLPAVPTETKIAVGIPCLTQDQVPARPDFVTDAQLAAKPDAALVFSLAADRLSRQDYEGQLEATLSGCVGETAVPAGVPVPVAPADKPWWQFWKEKP